MKSFANNDDDDFESIHKPDVCNELVSVRKYVVTPYKKQCLDLEQDIETGLKNKIDNTIKKVDDNDKIKSIELDLTVSSTESDMNLLNIYKQNDKL